MKFSSAILITAPLLDSDFEHPVLETSLTFKSIAHRESLRERQPVQETIRKSELSGGSALVVEKIRHR